MSLKDVRPYFEKCAKAQGFTVLKEAFSKQAMPTNSGKQAFIDIQPAEATRHVNHAQYDVPVAIDLFLGKGRSTTDLEAKSFDAAQSMVGEVFKAHRENGIFHVFCTQIEPQPINEANDNAVIVHLEFTAKVISDF